MKTWPHSVHSFKAVSSLLMVAAFISISGRPVGEASLISDKAATALATTMGFESLNSSLSESKNPCSSTSYKTDSYH